MGGMTNPDITTRVRAYFDQFTAEERGGVDELLLVQESAPCRFDGEDGLAAEVLHEDGPPVLLVRTEAFGDAPADEDIVRALVYALDRWHEDREAAREIPDDAALFAAHAAFRRGEPASPGWYRRGETIAPGVWLVDLDLFVELVVRGGTFAAMAGQELTLYLDDEPVAFEAPAQPEADEVWTLPESGLFEADPGQEELEAESDAEDDDVELTGRAGDLHVVPCVMPSVTLT